MTCADDNIDDSKIGSNRKPHTLISIIDVTQRTDQIDCQFNKHWSFFRTQGGQVFELCKFVHGDVVYRNNRPIDSYPPYNTALPSIYIHNSSNSSQPHLIQI